MKDTSTCDARSTDGLSATRSIVLCFDGTSNHFSERNTNVVKLVELLSKNDPSTQMVYYQTGVGTYSHPGFWTSITEVIAKKADEAVAWYLYQHVIDGYRFIMESYREGDEISIFGFSRGAYTARALAGMLHAVGILPKHNLEHIPFAYQVYAGKISAQQSREWRPTGDAGLGESQEGLLGALNIEKNEHDRERSSSNPDEVNPKSYKMTFCTPVKISFLGVWDTVGSVGALKRETLPWIEYNPSVIHFRHALALDEFRGHFIPSIWDHGRSVRGSQTAVEVWFRGSHSDVGGGSPLTDRARRNPVSRFWDKVFIRIYSLFGKRAFPFPRWVVGRGRLPDMSNISFRWMMNQCISTPNVRIRLDASSLARYEKAGILAPPIGRSGHTPLGRALDTYDSTKEPYEATEDSPWWWLMEVLPLPKPSQRNVDRSVVETTYWPNLKAGRRIGNQPVDQIFLHRSAHELQQSGYRYRAKFKNTPQVRD
ncbi:hypothetical protein RHS03_07791, partial [Rhizoctonia solani]